MKKVNIVIMGKTGAGKSTLLNTVFGSPVAKVGIGGAITKENMIYRCELDNMELNLYDTIGLELNSSLNDKTLTDIHNRIKVSNDNSNFDDVNVVWYCVNPNTERFEDYEADLINSLIFRFEVPFVIVLTQAYTKKKTQNIYGNISSRFPRFNIMPVLAENMETDAGDIEAYGVAELLNLTINEYNILKVNLLNAKQSDLNKRIATMRNELNAKKLQAEKVIEKHAKTAFGLGCVPGLSILSYQPTYIAAVNEINLVFGIKMDAGTVAEIVGYIIGGLICTPIFAIPIAGGWLSKELVSDFGTDYLKAVVSIFEKSDGIYDNELICERIKAELQKRRER